VGRFDYVVDAADGVADKAAIVHSCVLSSTPVVVSGGVGGLVNPALLAVSDLVDAKGDNLVMRLRRTLRTTYGYPKQVVKNGKGEQRWTVFLYVNNFDKIDKYNVI